MCFTGAFANSLSISFALNANMKKRPSYDERLFMVNLPRQFWNTFWLDFELLHDSLIILGVFDVEL